MLGERLGAAFADKVVFGLGSNENSEKTFA